MDDDAVNTPSAGLASTVVCLLVVADEEEEFHVISRLDAFEAAIGNVVIPVLDRGALLESVIESLRQAGSLVRVERSFSYTVPQQVEDLVLTRTRRHHRNRPEAVLVAGSVDPACQRLAAGLCSTEPVPLAAETLDRWNSNVSTALVLLDPRAVKTGSLLPILSGLASRIRCMGFIYALDPLETRLALLKTLAVNRLPGLDDMLLLSMQYPPNHADGAPACFADPSGPTGLALLHQPCDLLLLSGHANPLDATFGRDKALCARAGTMQEVVENRVYPCFSSGECFRQPRMRRAVADTEGLLSLRDFKARIIALIGCHMVSVGESWFDPGITLAYQCQQSAATAAFVTSGLSVERLELNFLLMVLLSEGRPLGEVAQAVNRVRLELHGHATSLPGYLGPFLVLGNPCLQFAADSPVTREARWISRQTFQIELDGIVADPCRGAFVRIYLPKIDPPFLRLGAAPEGLWCRGVLYPQDASDTLYLWLGVPRERDAELCGVLQVDAGETAPPSTLRALESYMRQLPFWMVNLDSFRADSDEAPHCVATLTSALEMLPAWSRRLSLAANTVRSRPGILIDSQKMRTLEEEVLAQAEVMARKLLDCLLDICCTFGTMHSGGWENSLERIGAEGPLDICGCGAGPVWGQRSRFIGIESLERVEYQCARCGAVGEDDGRRLLRFTQAPAWVQRGQWLRCRCTCHAPTAERVQCLAMLVVEGLYEGVRVVGDVMNLTIEPDSYIEFDIDVEVPETMRPGIYPFAMVGVVNGASYLIRQMIEVRAETSTRMQSGTMSMTNNMPSDVTNVEWEENEIDPTQKAAG